MPRSLSRMIVLVAALGAARALAPAAAFAAEERDPPDPLNDPMMITAGFLTHHPDMKYRILGMKAYGAQRFDDAMRYFRRASFYADKPSQGMVAEMYWNGDGVPRDRAVAYAWMDLAAERGYEGFIGLRERYWAQMTDDERTRAVREGQAVYARFGDDAAKPRYAFQLRTGRRNLTGSRTGFTGNHVQILVPGIGGEQTIDGSRFFDERYWDAKKYWAWQDRTWKKPKIGRVDVGDVQTVRDGARPGTRIPETRPEANAAEPAVPEEPAPTSPSSQDRPPVPPA